MLTLSRDLIVAPLALTGSGTVLNSITLSILLLSQRGDTGSFRSRSMRRSLTKYSVKWVIVRASLLRLGYRMSYVPFVSGKGTFSETAA